MNSQNAKDYLPFVQALAEGKTIQNRPPGCHRWIDGNEWLFDNAPLCYRIKPEPRRVWVCYKRNVQPMFTVTQEEYNERNDAQRDGLVEFVEVLK